MTGLHMQEEAHTTKWRSVALGPGNNGRDLSVSPAELGPSPQECHGSLSDALSRGL